MRRPPQNLRPRRHHDDRTDITSIQRHAKWSEYMNVHHASSGSVSDSKKIVLPAEPMPYSGRPRCDVISTVEQLQRKRDAVMQPSPQNPTPDICALMLLIEPKRPGMLYRSVFLVLRSKPPSVLPRERQLTIPSECHTLQGT